MSIPKYDPAEKRLVALSSKTLARPSYTTRTWLLEYGEDWKVVPPLSVIPATTSILKRLKSLNP